MRAYKIGLVLVCFIGVFMFINRSQTMTVYVASLKEEPAVPVMQMSPQSPLTNEQLLLEIESKAKTSRVEPVNAVLDRVWKAIPGYNGRQLDIEQTYHFAKNYQGLDYPLFYQEISPQIQLHDLEPAPIYKGNPNKPMASLMINVAWGNEYITSILNTLQEANVKATFFFDGSWLNKNREIALEIFEKGHEVSNHGYSHKDMSTLNRTAALEEITKTEALLEEIFQVENSLFAPPSGDFKQETVEIAHELGLHTILWTIDTVDWKNPGAAWIIQRIKSRIEPGALILMHPTSSSSEALAEMIEVIKQKGLVLGPVSELISSTRISPVEQDFEFW